MTAERERMGSVVGGSLTKSIEVRLEPGKSAGLGEYLVSPLPEGGDLLGMVTDVLLKSAEAGATSWPPGADDGPLAALLREVLLDTGVYTAVEVNPYLEVEADGATARARRLPRHFARVTRADQEILNRAFAVDEERGAVRVGTPLGMDDVTVFVDIEKLFERSAGVFGKSGTGKSVATMQIPDAMVANSRAARVNGERTVALIFDMHNDYGWDMKFQGEGARARKSLKQRHGSDVAVYSLDPDVLNTDARLVVGTQDITPEDLDVLQSIGAFTGPAIEAAHECHSRFGRTWIDDISADDPSPSVIRKTFREGDEPDDPNWTKVAQRLGFHSGSFENLRRGLRRFTRRGFVQSGTGQFSGALNHIVQTLKGGKSVVVQFGKFGSDLTAYMLVANMLSRRIWEQYSEAVEKAQGRAQDEPNRLVIVIEEAHKFIDRSMAGQSIFGQIARELRKYNVTLFVIDQRPSQIDAEVLSQIGTKFCFQLDSEADIEALVGGMQGRSGLRSVIASLESRQQALVFGHALPMPVVVRPPDLTANFEAGASLRDRLGAPPANVAAKLKPIFG